MIRTLARLLVLAIAAAGLAGPATAAAPNYAVTAHIKIADGGFDYSSFDPVHRRFYVTRSPGVTAVDVDSGTVSTIAPQVQRGHEPLVLDHGARLLVTDSATDGVHVVNALTGASVTDIATDKRPDAAVFDPATGLAVVMNAGAGDVSLVDPRTLKTVGTVAIGGSLEFGAADGAGRVFVNVEDQNQIAVIDTRARKVVARYPLVGCKSPGGLAYAPWAGVLISACRNNVAKVLNAATGAEVATLTIGGFSDAVMVDPVRKLAFIPCALEGVLEVIAVRSPTDVAIVQQAKTQQGARSGAVDPKSGRVFLPTAHYVIQPGARPTPQPGTFEILVVSPG